VTTPKSFQQIVIEALRNIPEVGPPALASRHEGGEQNVVIDVREPDELGKGKIPGAYTITRGVRVMQVDGRLHREAKVML